MATAPRGARACARQGKIDRAVEVARKYAMYQEHIDDTLFEHQTYRLLTIANTDDLRVRFPHYNGNFNRFSYDKVKCQPFELALKKHVTGRSTIAPREIRKLYREQALRDHAERDAKVQEPRQQDDTEPILRRPRMTTMPQPSLIHLAKPTPTLECIRCAQMKRGVLESFTTAPHLEACAFKVDMSTKTDSIKGDKRSALLSPQFKRAYPSTMAISVALTASRRSEVIPAEEPLEKKMEREIASQEMEMTHTQHRCERVKIRLTGVRYLNTRGAKKDTVSKRILIFAPPKSGKNVLQHKLMQKQIATIDTEDHPHARATDVAIWLKKTTVMTNRLDLLEQAPKEATKVVFLPRSSILLQERIKKVNSQIVKAWWDKAFKVAYSDPNTKIVWMEDTQAVISTWFHL